MINEHNAIRYLIKEFKKLERKVDELKAYIESERIFRNFVNETNDGLTIITPNGTIAFTNIAFAKMLGYENSNDIIGKNIKEIIIKEKADEIFNDLANYIESMSIPKLIKVEYIKKDKTFIKAEMNPMPIIKEGEVIALIAVHREVS
ncbi:MAG: PAS domain S-box protein [Desulfobacterales bacterium]|nr:PAS domain S-box protein [Desulfobacterales bacterium]MBF0395189.1 PAS domain S-box protein [Desulfobacterales bacterium]